MTVIFVCRKEFLANLVIQHIRNSLKMTNFGFQYTIHNYLLTFLTEEFITNFCPQGRAVADACKQNNVKHLVFSGLEPCMKEIGIPVPHFESKVAVEEYIEQQKV